ncbi:sigma-70 family RNA polymerase sigma factor [Salibacterium halotolerans]|uniref:RNA polymerase sigma factor, sigma-70 family n=1 Tax=Salibacterium halotolerans TaxID=1884432 RepID=A0A1I5N9A2_9BACI|nr:sigma-70 family RNA polymerase sigma factor [Salibacterium halotolerans]SFP18277.1 hypothetical protein SAMN05518683_10343 [Salibacterium halotolerans]
MNHKEIENLISDYSLMKREIIRLEELVHGIGGSASPSNDKLIAQYGLEAVMPKGSKEKSQIELKNLDRREQKLLKRIQVYQELIDFIEDAEELVNDTLQQMVYNCMMEGMSYRAIGKHLGISREKVRQTRDDLINHLCQNCQFCQSWRYLQYHKQYV